MSRSALFRRLSSSLSLPLRVSIEYAEEDSGAVPVKRKDWNIEIQRRFEIKKGGLDERSMQDHDKSTDHST